MKEMYFVKSEATTRGHGFSSGSNSESGISVNITDTTVEIKHHFGPAPTWNDILEVLRFEDLLGSLVNSGKDAIDACGVDGSGSKWRVERHIRPSGAEELRIRVRDAVTARYNTGGKVVCRLHISCAGKLNEGLPVMTHAQFFTILNELYDTKHDDRSGAYVYLGAVRRAPVYEGEWN